MFNSLPIYKKRNNFSCYESIIEDLRIKKKNFFLIDKFYFELEYLNPSLSVPGLIKGVISDADLCFLEKGLTKLKAYFYT